jgi:hypothetical protein
MVSMVRSGGVVPRTDKIVRSERAGFKSEFLRSAPAHARW